MNSRDEAACSDEEVSCQLGAKRKIQYSAINT